MWKRQASSPPPLKRSVGVQNPWHAVSIVAGASCCDAAKNLSTTRYLSHQAPRLPLAECTKASDCRCSYLHHEDRRGRPRRAAEAGAAWPEPYIGHDRRRERGRRATDISFINDWKG